MTNAKKLSVRLSLAALGVSVLAWLLPFEGTLRSPLTYLLEGSQRTSDHSIREELNRNRASGTSASSDTEPLGSESILRSASERIEDTRTPIPPQKPHNDPAPAPRPEPEPDLPILYQASPFVLTDRDVRFGFDINGLSDSAKKALDQFATHVRMNFGRDIYIEIQGHTDATGSENSNTDRGLARAQAVRRYLSEHHGIPIHRMSVISYGETEPIADNSTKEGRSQNRRVVLVVLGPR
jgi:outer membrane protein OmpA-like peptidoglycan-associated protein